MVDPSAAVQTVTCEAEGFEFEAPVGSSLMLALKGTGFDIEASCEGCLVCGTCHVQGHDPCEERWNQSERETPSHRRTLREIPKSVV